MTTSKLIYQVDAFTDKPFKGNPACVCILNNEMPAEWMQNIAAEMNLSETAFIFPENRKFRIRFFTPETEVPLCGHATLSSGHIMYETGIIDKKQELVFLSNAGELMIRSEGSWIIMNFPSYSLEKLQIPEGFEKSTGIKPVEIYSTGHVWTLVLLQSEDEVRELQPDFNAIKTSDFKALIVTAPSSDPRFDFSVRCFVPALGINEDPVTGSAHCALVPFWHMKTNKTEFISHQISKRSGILKVSLKDSRVKISGQAITILRAELFV